jgi:hypothetical protein
MAAQARNLLMPSSTLFKWSDSLKVLWAVASAASSSAVKVLRGGVRPDGSASRPTDVSALVAGQCFNHLVPGDDTLRLVPQLVEGMKRKEGPPPPEFGAMLQRGGDLVQHTVAALRATISPVALVAPRAPGVAGVAGAVADTPPIDARPEMAKQRAPEVLARFKQLARDEVAKVTGEDTTQQLEGALDALRAAAAAAAPLPETTAAQRLCDRP